MHFLKTGRVGLLAAIAAVIALVSVLPLFGSTAYAAGLNLDGTAAFTRFVIPGTHVTRTTVKLGVGQSVPFTLTVTDASPFPATCPPEPRCQLLISRGDWGDGLKPQAEVLEYDTRTATSFNIVSRAPTKGGVPKQHEIGSLLKLATTSTAALGACPPLTCVAADGPQSNLTSAITAIQGGCTIIPPATTYATCPAGDLPAPFMITLTSTAGFSASGAISINHQDAQTSNLLGGQAGEMMQYDMTGVGANQLRIVRRAQDPINRAYVHRANGYAQPDGNLGRTKVSQHFQLAVKSNAGFFPAGSLLVCDLTNPLTNCELIGHNNSAGKIKTPSATEFHMTERGAPSDTTYKKTTPSAHGIGSLVTGGDGFLFCRNRNNQPGVDIDLGTPGFQEPATQVAGTSVGVGAVCYSTTQPNGGPKPPPPPYYGQDLTVINSIAGQPFLSTGGFCHVVLGAVGIGGTCPGGPLPLPFDANGTGGGTLILQSPCITDFTPGTNLQVTITLPVDKLHTTPDVGTIRVVLDTVHPTGTTPGPCDDPSGLDLITSTTYDTLITKGVDAEATEDNSTLGLDDDDTDNDGCHDVRELHYLRTQGGLRDPWNPYDYYDINHDGAVNVVTDILQVAAAFGPGDPDYAPRKDRGSLNYGPFGWNKSAPNGSVDVVNDILGVATQFGDPCPHNHALYVGADAPWYGAGVVPGH